MKKEPIAAKEREASKRRSDFEEEVLGYAEEDALKEAARCIQCKNPTCIASCPVGIDIKKFIAQLTGKDYAAAYSTIREKNNFPSICGRVCPAEYQCRLGCVFSKKGSPFASNEAINIHFLERFAGDFGMRKGLSVAGSVDPKLAKFKVAVVGSGPAGMACAGELARYGIKVTVFEGLQKPGGVLRYGIPPFRMPRDILDFEIDCLKELGVEIVCNHIIGKTKTLDELFKEGYAAVFLGLGAGIPSFMGIPGENLCNIYSANEFLTRINLMSAYKFPEFHTPVNIGKKMLVIGGGNTAMDSARASLRLQNMAWIPPDTTIVYRRTEVEMPARRLEIEHAKEEGVNFKFIVQPTEFAGEENGFVKTLRCLECKLGDPDESGRRKPLPVKGSEFEMGCDVAILAIGLKANQLLISVTPQLKTDKYGDIIVNGQTMETSIKGVFAGGDIVGGEGTVIEAMGMAKKAALGIADYLRNKK